MATKGTPRTSLSLQVASIYPTYPAWLYSHSHPILVLSTLRIRLDPLINNPTTTLTSLLLPLACAQAVYAIVCLPQVNPSVQSANRTGAKGKVKGKGKAQTRSKPHNESFRVLLSTAILSIVLSLVVGTAVVTVALILFGAPLTTHIPQTVLLSAHLSLLAGVPLLYTYGVDAVAWRRLLAVKVPIDEVLGGALGAIVGAWLGAIPIPLDWDRDWQKWPVTIIGGAYGGWFIGILMGKYILRGKTI